MSEQNSDVGTDMASRLDRIEAALERLTERLASTSDTVDEDRFRGALVLAERLSEPATTDAMQQLLARMDSVEAAVRSLSTLVQKAPVIADMLADTTAELVRRAEARGVDVVARAEAGMALAERATAPEVMDLANKGMSDASVALGHKLLDTADQVGPLIDAATAPQAIEAAEHLASLAPTLSGMTDVAVGVYDSVAEGRDVEALGAKAGAAAAKLADVALRGDLDRLLDSGALDPQAIEVIAGASRALVATRGSAVDPVGAFGMLKAMGDPDVQRATGFALAFARQFGRQLDGKLVKG